jgi:hypothetical protein
MKINGVVFTFLLFWIITGPFVSMMAWGDLGIVVYLISLLPICGVWRSRARKQNDLVEK